MDFSKYVVTTPRPNRPAHPRQPDRMSRNNPTIEQVEAYIAAINLYKDELVVYEAAMKEYYYDLAIYHAESREVIERFKQDALKEVGLNGHKNVDKMWRYIADKSQDSFESIFYELEDLAELIL